MIFSGTVKKIKKFSRHNSMPENIVYYLNIKMPDILVEIINLNLLVNSNEMACRKRGRLGLDHIS